MSRPPGLTRRGVLGGAALLAGLPRRARASVSNADRTFLFVVNYGGWDPLLAFAPLFGVEHVEMEAEAALGTAGGISFVDHPDRPSVRAFFEAQHARTLVVNGMIVPSVAHPPGQRAVLTGYTHEAIAGDWPSLLGAGAADRYVLPHVVLSGPSFPGDHADIVCRSGSHGQLDLLLSGALGDTLDVPVAAPTAARQSAVDAYLSGRAARFAAAAGEGRARTIADGYVKGVERVAALKDRQGDVVWGSTTTWDDQLDRTVEILRAGIARCVTVSFEYWPWDTHVANDPYQSQNFEALFAGLLRLSALLETSPGRVAATLAEEVTVVVLSEMGRTPLHNPSSGRDHWPYTSVMLVGGGVTGDRVVGGLDDGYYGLPVDLASGELADDGVVIDPTTLGATLLALGDVDPAEALPEATVLDGVLA